MRVVVLFDLPTGTIMERRAATQFRNYLLRDGFNMLQYSVYVRLCPNKDSADKHVARVRRHAPDKGSIRAFYLTENQFTNMYVLAGEISTQEKKLPVKQMAFF